MQVVIRVSRLLPDGTNAHFECTAPSVEEAIKIADQLATGKADTVADAKTAVTKESKADPKKDSAKDAAKSNTAAEPTKEKSGTAGTSSEPAAPSYDLVKKAITDVATAKGRDMAVAMLQRFGVTGGKDLKAEQYAELLTTAAGVLDGSIDPTAACVEDDIS